MVTTKNNPFQLILLLFGILLISSIATAQNQRDSLKALVNYQKEDKTLMKQFIMNGNMNFRTDLSLSKAYGTEAYLLAQELNDPVGEGDALNLLGTVEYLKGNFDQAFVYLEEAIKIGKEISDKRLLAKSYSGIAAIYKDRGELDRCIEYLLVSVDYMKSMKDTLGTAKVTGNIANFYNYMEDWVQSKFYFKEALKYANATNDLRLRAGLCTGLALSHKSLGEIDSALIILDAVDIMVPDPSSDPINYCRALFTRGDIHLVNEHYDSAYMAHKEVEKIFMEYEFKPKLLDARSRLAEDFIKLGQIDSAKYYLHKVMHAEEANVFMLLRTYKLMTQVYIIDGQPDSADYYFTETMLVRNEVMASDKLEKAQKLEVQYETEQLKGEVAEAQYEVQLANAVNDQQNLWLIIIGIVSVSGFIISLLLYQRNKRKREQEFVRLEHQLLKARMNPHFIFNCLNSIQKLYAKNERDKANDYMADFAVLIRKTLNHTGAQTIPLAEEIDLLVLYLEMEKLRVNGRFDYEINVGKKVLVNYDVIPPMLIQPLVENAIWHGVLPAKRPGKIDINFSRKKSGISCIVKDNGVGFKTENKRRESKGLGLIEKRIRRDIQVRQLNPGTEVSILIQKK